MLFADDAALTAHSEEALQSHMSSFAHACREFGLTISLRTRRPQCPQRSNRRLLDDYTMEVVGEFVYLGSTISSNLYLDTELDKRIGKVATAMARLTKKVCDNAMPTMKTKTVVYKACVLS